MTQGNMAVELRAAEIPTSPPYFLRVPYLRLRFNKLLTIPSSMGTMLLVLSPQI